MNRPPALAPLCLLLLLTACGSNSGDPTKVAYAPSLGVDLSVMHRSDTGLYTLDVQEGTGVEATSGRLLTVTYSGWLPDGSLFDSSDQSGRTFSFTLGAGQFIAGWDEGLVGMKAGGKRRLILPSQLGYGAQGQGSIPPDSVLIFDVSLLSVR